MGTPVSTDWAVLGHEAGASASASASGEQSKAPDSVEQMQDIGYQTKKLGFVEGAIVIEKGATNVEYWRIKKIAKAVVHVVKQEDGADTDQRTVALDLLAEKWRLHKGRVTSCVPGWGEDAASNLLSSVAWHTEQIKGAANIAMAEQYRLHQHIFDDLTLLQHPASVKAERDFGKGEVRLVGASTLIETAKANTSGIPIGDFPMPSGESQVFVVMPRFATPQTPQGEKNKNAWCAPFWCVGPATTAKTANMELIYESVQVGPFKVAVPILSNHKPVKKGAILTWHKQTKVPLPEGGHGFVASEASGAQESAATGRKRKAAP